VLPAAEQVAGLESDQRALGEGELTVVVIQAGRR
jgi:hypothetical protein